MKFLMTIAMLGLLMVGCTKKDETTGGSTTPPVTVGCIVEDGISGFVSTAVAKELACANVEAVKASVKDQLSKLNLCKKADAAQMGVKSTVGDIVCPIVSSALVGTITSQIPAEWGCTGNGKPEVLKDIIAKECAKAL